MSISVAVTNQCEMSQAVLLIQLNTHALQTSIKILQKSIDQHYSIENMSINPQQQMWPIGGLVCTLDIMVLLRHHQLDDQYHWIQTY